MKTASVADLRNHFAAVSRWIYEGETVTINKRGKAFAALVPLPRRKVSPPWPDFETRLRRLFPKGPTKGATAKEIVDYMRGKY